MCVRTYVEQYTHAPAKWSLIKVAIYADTHEQPLNQTHRTSLKQESLRYETVDSSTLKCFA